MTTGRAHMDELRDLAARRASRRAVEPDPNPEPDDPPAGAATTLEALDLIAGMTRWRDASAAARTLAKSWGDRPPAGEPPAEPGR